MLLSLLIACSQTPAPEDAPVELPAVEAPAEAPAAAARTCRGPEDPGLAAPWTVGATTATGWTVTAVTDDHPDFTRVSFDKEGAATTLEVKYVDGETDDWATGHYRLMPAPEATPPEPLLEEAIATLRRVESDVGKGRIVAALPEGGALPRCTTGG